MAHTIIRDGTETVELQPSGWRGGVDPFGQRYGSSSPPVRDTEVSA